MDDVKVRSPAKEAEAALVAALRKRSVSGLAQLYDCYGQLVYSVVLRIVGDRGAAEEITQDVFLCCWNGIEQYRPERGSFSAWLLTITHHRAIDELRSRRNKEQRRSIFLDDLQALAARDGQIDAALLRIEVQAALAALPPEQRQVIELMYWDGWNRHELADRLDLPLGTVHTRLRLGMQKLRAACSHLFGDE